MKKLISMCVCLAMIISACLISNANNEALAGNAGGSSAKIKTQDEFTDLLRSASLVMSQQRLEPSDNSRNLKAKGRGSALLDEDTTIDSSIPYSEMTIYQTVFSNAKYKIDKRSEFSSNGSLYGIQYADIKENKAVDAVIYITDDAILFTASGTINYDVITEEATTKFIRDEYYLSGTYARDEIIYTSYTSDIDIEFSLYMDEDDLNDGYGNNDLRYCFFYIAPMSPMRDFLLREK